MAEPAPRVLLARAASAGGVGAHVRTIASELASRGWAVTVASPADRGAPLPPEPGTATHVAVDLGAGSAATVWRTRRQLRQLADAADVVHVHGLRAAAQVVTAGVRPPVVATWHNAPLAGRRHRVSQAVLGRVASRADLVLAASDDLADRARTAGATAVRTTFVGAPALPGSGRSREEVRAALGVPDQLLVLAVGRLHRQKRFDLLVDALSRLRGQDDPNVVGLIAGEGPDRAELERRIAATSAPVRLLGHRDDVADLLLAADVVALPSEWEARPLVAQEALRAGVPLVTTAAGGTADLVGDAALFVPGGDAAALASALAALLADPDRRRRLGEMGRSRARSWPTVEQEVDRLVEDYLTLMARSRL